MTLLSREGNELNFPQWLQINQATRTLIGEPDEIGIFKIKIIAVDPNNGIGYQQFEIQVYSYPPIENSNLTLQIQFD